MLKLNSFTKIPKIQFARLPSPLSKASSMQDKEEAGLTYFSATNDSATKNEYYTLKEVGAKGGWKIKKDVLQQYLLFRRAIYASYSKYKEQGSLHLDILDLDKQLQYPGSSNFKHESDPVFHYSVKAAKITALCTKNNQGENGAPLKSHIAVLAGLQVGVVQYHDLQINDKAYVYLSELAVDPDHQGKGIGQQLIKKVLDDVNKAKLPCLLITRSFNENAKALYLKLGFQQLAGDEGGHLVSGCGYSPNSYIALKYIPLLPNLFEAKE